MVLSCIYSAEISFILLVLSVRKVLANSPSFSGAIAISCKDLKLDVEHHLLPYPLLVTSIVLLLVHHRYVEYVFLRHGLKHFFRVGLHELFLQRCTGTDSRFYLKNVRTDRNTPVMKNLVQKVVVYSTWRGTAAAWSAKGCNASLARHVKIDTSCKESGGVTLVKFCRPACSVSKIGAASVNVVQD